MIRISIKINSPDNTPLAMLLPYNLSMCMFKFVKILTKNVLLWRKPNEIITLNRHVF